MIARWKWVGGIVIVAGILAGTVLTIASYSSPPPLEVRPWYRRCAKVENEFIYDPDGDYITHQWNFFGWSQGDYFDGVWMTSVIVDDWIQVENCLRVGKFSSDVKDTGFITDHILVGFGEKTGETWLNYHLVCVYDYDGAKNVVLEEHQILTVFTENGRIVSIAEGANWGTTLVGRR